MPTAVRDYYQVLGVSRDTSEAEIKATYKRLARQYHPDRNPGDKRAEERFKQISEAYAVLGDPQKRRQYDLTGGAGFSSGFDAEEFLRRARGGFSFAGFGGLGDLFEEVFTGMGGAQPFGRSWTEPPPARGADLRASLHVEFEQAARGAEVPIEVARRVACSRCRGGRTAGAGACVACGGTGQQAFSRGVVQLRRTCPQCGGTGRAARACPACQGRGTVPRLQRVKVRVPAGVRDGATIRLPGLGEEGGSGGGAGDLYIDIHVRPHRFFKRDGNDILIDLPVSLGEAACGANIRVPTIDGWATLKLPAGTSSGRRLRLRGKGVRAPRGGRRGDQYVIVQVVLPEHLDERSLELVREFERRNPGPPAARCRWERS